MPSFRSFSKNACRLLGFLTRVVSIGIAVFANPAHAQQALAPINEGKLVRLTGNVHPGARPEFDRGLVDPQLPMDRMLLILKRTPQQEAALESFMAGQLDR